MASSAGRAKRDREKARQEKAALKRNRRQSGEGVVVDDEPSADPRFGARKREQDEVLADLARLHQRFEDESIDFDTFELAKNDLIAELDV